MVVFVSTVAFEGIEARPVDVQVHVANGLPAFTIVGLPDKAVSEARERVRAALVASGLSLPPKRITINLSPADLPKEGSHFDLPIAVGLMAAVEALPADSIKHFTVLGELALDGSLTPVQGVLPAAVYANAQGRGLICPQGNGAEAAWAGDDMPLLAPASLLTLANHIKGTQILSRPQPSLPEAVSDLKDLRDVKGQESAKRALEITAAGGHNLLMVGPPGAGKSMLASRLPGLLPALSPQEILDVAMIRSIAGDLAGGGLSNQRPFRAPHHSASMPSLIGGGGRARPGEIALAHHGVLFLDELPEFQPTVLDALRQPLENGEVLVTRANYRITYPARFQLIAAMNPCRCGYAGEPGHKCKRGIRCEQEYQARLSGPFLDRIDIHLDMPSVSASDLLLPSPKEGTREVAQRVAQARLRQSMRMKHLGQPEHLTNAQVSPALLESVLALDGDATAFLNNAANAMKLSARGFHRILKVARTIADLDDTPQVSLQHLGEALSYRTLMNRTTEMSA